MRGRATLEAHRLETGQGDVAHATDDLSTEGISRRYRAYASPMAIVRLFASAREAAGTGRDVIEGATVADVLAAARSRYGPTFAAVLITAKVWVNGEPVPESTTVGPRDEVAVLPPVSGGADGYDPAPMDLPLFERVTSDGYLGDVKVRSLDEIRSLRRECQRVEANLSYLRRLAQGRIDMVADAATRSALGEPIENLGDVIAHLPESLGERIIGSARGRLTESLGPEPDPTITDKLDQVCDSDAIASLPSMSTAELAELRDRLVEFERDVSDRRKQVFVLLDTLSGELARRYREGEASVDALLD
jgi:molybdopterin synthase sulfur carrier subunit